MAHEHIARGRCDATLERGEVVLYADKMMILVRTKSRKIGSMSVRRQTEYENWVTDSLLMRIRCVEGDIWIYAYKKWV